MRHWLAIAWTIVFAVLGVGAHAAAQTAEDVVKITTETVLQRVRADRDSLQSDPQRLRALVEEMIVPNFDFRRMSQWVLGKYWRDTDAATQARFVDEFKTLLIHTYSTALTEYATENIGYKPGQTDPNSNSVLIKTELERIREQVQNVE